MSKKYKYRLTIEFKTEKKLKYKLSNKFILFAYGLTYFVESKIADGYVFGSGKTKLKRLK